VSPRSRTTGGTFRTWFSIDPQPASISPTINISIVFICAFVVDHGWIIYHSAIKNDSGADPAKRAPFRKGASSNQRHSLTANKHTPCSKIPMKSKAKPSLDLL